MQTVYVGLSGGVDSSVTAALLQRQGYRVVGVYMQNWTTSFAGLECPWKEDLADAKAVAAMLGIPFKVFDFQHQYKQLVVDHMLAEFATGRTPNPDVMCNQEIKFKLFLEAAVADGADLIATGHYARIKDGQLWAGADDNKDQSYFLYRVSESALRRTLMPLGAMTKPQVRQLAKKLGLPTAAKKDSVGICFVGEVGIKDFLRQYLTVRPGPVKLLDGTEVGSHDGAVFYTLGQRHGLGIGGGMPYYVVGKDVGSNTIYVTTDPGDEQLYRRDFRIDEVSWISNQPEEGKTYQIRTRYCGPLITGILQKTESGWLVALDQPMRAVTAGQSTVIYDGERVLGGGVINLPVMAASYAKGA